MESSNPLQQLLVRGIGTTNVVADRLKSVIQGWVTSGRIDASQASSLIEEVSGAMRGDNPLLAGLAVALGHQFKKAAQPLLYAPLPH